MSERTLRDYAREIREQLDAGEAAEALRGARFLLQLYPRYLRGYRLLGEAALEQGRYRDAIELFRRVLSVDPESFGAHAGLASAYEHERDIDEALWHMMRAFEVKPDLRGVRDQLRHLYELRDGRAPGRLHLNRVALARVYMRDGWYDKAIEEFEHELTQDPDRVDLLAALTEAQWRAGRRPEAAQRANRLLLELPYSLKGNLILGQFHARAGESQRAARHLEIARELDPDNEMAAELFGDESILAPIPVTVSAIDAARTRQQMTSVDSEVPEWLSDLTLFTAPDTLDDEVDWAAIVAHESDWRTALRGATERAIGDFSPDWRVDLRRRVGLALEEIEGRPRRERAPRRMTRETTPAPLWRHALRTSTFRALAEWRGVQPITEPWDTTALRAATERALERPAEAPPIWRAALRDATAAALGDRPPPEDWRAPLREESEQALSDPRWRAALREATGDVLSTWRDGWRRPLRDATDDALAEDRLGSEVSWGSKPAEAEPDVSWGSSPAAAADTTAPWRDRLRDESARGLTDETTRAWRYRLSDATRDALARLETPDVGTDEGSLLTQAEAAWNDGDADGALVHFATLADREGEPAADLVEALERWAATEKAPAPAHQLLGQLYQRLGRLDDAVEQYRIAISRM